MYVTFARFDIDEFNSKRYTVVLVECRPVVVYNLHHSVANDWYRVWSSFKRREWTSITSIGGDAKADTRVNTWILVYMMYTMRWFGKKRTLENRNALQYAGHGLTVVV